MTSTRGYVVCFLLRVSYLCVVCRIKIHYLWREGVVSTLILRFISNFPSSQIDPVSCQFYIKHYSITVIQNPRSRSLIQKWWSYKKYFFYALGSSLHHIFWWLNTENIFFPLNDHFWEAWSDPIFMILAISTFSM